MKTSISEAFTVSVIAVVAALFLIVWVYYGTASLTEQAKDRTVRITTCVELGGTWLEQNGDCIK